MADKPRRTRPRRRGKPTWAPQECVNCNAAGCERCGHSGYVRGRPDGRRITPVPVEMLSAPQQNWHYLQRARRERGEAA